MQMGARAARIPHVKSDLAEAFRARGLKVTPQPQIPGFSLRTVYTTRTYLVEMGEMSQLAVSSTTTRFDPNTVDHHHAVCSACGPGGTIAAHSLPRPEL